MPHYVTCHTLTCLTRQGAVQLVDRCRQAGGLRVLRAQANLQDGRMLLEWSALDREMLEHWLDSQNIHREWLMRVEYEAREGPLEPSA